MLTADDNDLLCRVEGDAPMGRLMRAHWMPACLSEEVGGTRRRAGARPPSGRGARRLSRQQRTARRAGRALPASPRVARTRAATRSAACAASTTAGRSTWKARSSSARRSRLEAARSGEDRHRAYPCREAGGFVWVWMGDPAAPARIRAAGVGTDAGHPHEHRQDARQLQLGAGARRRDRFRAQLEPALDRHGAGDAVDVDGKAAKEWLRPSLDRAPRLQVQRTALRVPLRRDPSSDRERRRRTITCGSRCSSRRSRR